eukprot:m.781 g.781  ORF g.781 m.781 type:complete len:70 (+) comp1251_c0_seq1:381-590(+)
MQDNGGNSVCPTQQDVIAVMPHQLGEFENKESVKHISARLASYSNGLVNTERKPALGVSIRRPLAPRMV